MNKSEFKFKFIDLFAGIGGFHLGLSQNGGECVFASEKDKYARQTYQANFDIDPNIFVGDITKIDPKNIPDHDILCAGFPCQPFSNAGKKLGFEDSRGTLFFEIAQILKTKQPKAFILENVRGLQNHDNGKTFSVIQNTIRELGYSFYFKVLKASDFGLPQLRPRMYMVGFKDLSIKFEFPKPIPLKFTMNDVFGGKVNREIGLTIRVGGRGSGINDRRNWDAYLVDGVERRIDVAEAQKMQGFPDNFKFEVSKTQALKQLGNAVAVDVVDAVAKSVLESWV